MIEYRSVKGFVGYRVGNDGSMWTRYKPRGGRTADGGYVGGMVLGNTWKRMKPTPGGSQGCLMVTLCNDSNRLKRFVHVIVLENFVGPRPSGLVARHGLNGKFDNSLSNLCWGTQKENIADKYRDGTRVFGESHHNAKMNPDKVREARESYRLGASCLGLASKYGIACSTMDMILKRRTWKEVE